MGPTQITNASEAYRDYILQQTQPVVWYRGSYTTSEFQQLQYYNIAMGQGTSRQTRAAQRKKKKERDLAALDQLANRGTSDFCLLHNDKHLVVVRHSDNEVLFTVGTAIKVDKAQKHLIKPLTALAEREGLAFQVVDALRVGKNLEVVDYWAWKARPEVDDSDLMVAVPEPPLRIGGMSYDSSLLRWDLEEPEIPF